ncbi:hypothetical protein FRB96_000180 [Tulasnella sp. 330]|nr:hypothetical protein FRB96_000180 [Tulasnella sp. 330]KAG8885912.1 hypothetical protein FRB97_009074 [Tulasnella sp. 331]KAG8891084.1 hypothetical protein FRB98_000093 [Tulasnella sp. 332]
MATSTPQPNKLATSSHMMKTTKRGRPFLKDTLDLFATLIVSLDLQTHKQYFKTFPNSFTTDEAAANLSSLKFSQSNRGPDPRDPSRIVTTTTTTTFSMTRDMAKAMCQHFMDARLIENAQDKQSNLFKDRGIYMLTPKGLHVLERFISKNGMTADHLLTVFSSQPICLKLLHLERRASDDEIIISQSVITALFRRFAGRSANYLPDDASTTTDPGQEYHERSKGIPVFDIEERPIQVAGRNIVTTFTHCFSAVAALEWLCDFTSIVARDEAAEMAAHFVRFGFIALVSDKRKGGDSAVIFTVRGSANGSVSAQGEFRCTAKAIYNITEAGRRIVRWDTSGRSLIHNLGMRASPNNSQTNLDSGHRSSNDHGSVENVTVASEVAFGPGGGEPVTAQTLAQTTDAKIHRRISMAEKLRGEFKNGEGMSGMSAAPKESNTDRLKHILDEPALRSLFREFLRGNFSEENLSFWLDVQDFKRRFNTTSSANAAPRTEASAKGTTPGQLAMEKHHEALISMAFVIYNTYLAPSSPCELNIDHGLRNDLRVYLNEVMAHSPNGGSANGASNGKVSTSSSNSGRLELGTAQLQMHTFNATQLQTMIKLYERIQTHVFRLMATDSVPKFIKTSRFMALRNWVEEYEIGETDVPGPSDSTASIVTATTPPAPPGLDDPEEIGRAYMSVSQQALGRPKTASARSDDTGINLVPTKSIAS